MSAKPELWRCGGGYGWMDMPPARMAGELKKATLRLGDHIKLLKPTAIAYSGNSGAPLAFIAGVFHQLPVIYVRKDEESTHGTPVESNANGGIASYIIVDDFICTGATVKRIIRKINKAAAEFNRRRPTCLGIYLYAASTSKKQFVVDDDVYDILD